MIVGTRASAWRRVGWRTGNEEMKVEEMKREKQRFQREVSCAEEQQIHHQEHVIQAANRGLR